MGTCRNGHALQEGQAFCPACGAQATLSSPAPSTYAPSPAQPPVVVAVRVPGTGALWLSIFGFCGITAILGIALGFTAMSQAKKLGVSQTKGLLAVVIGFLWLIPGALIWGFAALSTNQSAGSPGMGTPSSTFTSRAPVTPSPSGGAESDAVLVQRKLRDMGFKCELVNVNTLTSQCAKGKWQDQTYGEIDREFVNFFPTDAGEADIEGYVLPDTAKALKKFGVKSLGDDGSGMGTVLISSRS
jgi:hypothetical protein